MNESIEEKHKKLVAEMNWKEKRMAIVQKRWGSVKEGWDALEKHEKTRPT